MEKTRVGLAIVLSLGVMLAWQYFFAPPPPADQKPAEKAKSAPGQPAPGPTVPAPPVPVVMGPPKDVTVETSLWTATFSNTGGVLTKFVLKKLPNGRTLKAGDGSPELNLVSTRAHKVDEKTPAELGAPFQVRIPTDKALETTLNTANYAVGGDVTDIRVPDGSTRELTFTLADANGATVTKKFVFRGGQFLFDYVIDAKRAGQPVPTMVSIGPNFGDQSIKNFDGYTNTPPHAVMYDTASRFVAFSSVKPDAPQNYANVAWGALTDHYFAFTFVPAKPVATGTLANTQVDSLVGGKPAKRDYVAASLAVENGAVNSVYLGPKDRSYLIAANEVLRKERGSTADLRELIDYGWMSFLVRPMIPVLDWLLRFFYAQVNNYGWAIVLVTFVVNMLLFPLRWKTASSFRKAGVHAPKLKELQERYKELQKMKVKLDDPRMLQLQKEQMQATKDSLPVMGCLPLLLQMPVFFAMYIYLQQSVNLRQAVFGGWLHDLSAPDPLHILPIALCVTQIGQSYLMPQPATPPDPAMEMQRKIMVWVMPIIFAAFFFWSAPSGLVVYWMAGNIIGIVQQLVINKMLGPVTPPSAPETETKPDKKKDLKPRTA
jgi:YidC/Oxa1 family membrane protein insertase